LSLLEVVQPCLLTSLLSTAEMLGLSLFVSPLQLILYCFNLILNNLKASNVFQTLELVFRIVRRSVPVLFLTDTLLYTHARAGQYFGADDLRVFDFHFYSKLHVSIVSRATFSFSAEKVN